MKSKENALNSGNFYGFIDELDAATAEQIADHLRSEAVGAIYADDTKGSLVEEIVFRGGTLYSEAEAKEAVPWVHKESNTCAAKFPYREGETRKKATGYEEFDWRSLDDIQYMYGKYLQELVEDGRIKIQD